MSDLVVQEATQPTFFNAAPKDIVAQAAAMALPLCDVIEKQRLYTEIQGRKYVRVEGWQTLGNMLGILPRDTKVIELPDGSFEAYVDLINYRNGMVVGGGSALCGMDEKRWKGADRFARRSMAITRATGKAYRLSFGWIMTMSGYEATPYEEMPETITIEQPARAASKTPEHYTEERHQKQVLFGYIKKLGITNADEQKEIAAHIAKTKPKMVDIATTVDAYLLNPLGAN